MVEADAADGALHEDVSRVSAEATGAPSWSGACRHERKKENQVSVRDCISLAEAFERHADEEGEALARYRELAEGLGDSAAGAFVNQILTDEEMHHLLLRTMASWLRAQDAGAEALRVPPRANRTELLRRTRELRAHEREGIAAFRDLQPQLSGELAGVLGALLDVVITDSEKHEKLLAMVEKMLTSA